MDAGIENLFYTRGLLLSGSQGPHFRRCDMRWPVLNSHPDTELSPPVEALNVAAVCQATRALGPGLRAVVWVQGCPCRCPGCVAPDWMALKPARLNIAAISGLVIGVTACGFASVLVKEGVE